MAQTPNMHVLLESGGEAWHHARVRKLSGREAISQPFSFDLEVVCDAGHELPEDAAPGEEITAVIEEDGNEVRRIHGMLARVRQRFDAAGEHALFELRVVPRIARLSLVETQDVYLGQSVPDLLRTKLEQHGFSPEDFELRLLGNYPARELVVQYAESDLAFVSRLAEHVGISFFFEHQGGKDRLVFTDHPAGFGVSPHAEELRYQPRGETSGVFALAVTTDLVPTSFIVQDYNYRAPQVDLSACFEVEDGNGGGVVENGCHVKTPDEAERLAKIRGEERACRRRVHDGASGHPGLSAGLRSTLLDHPSFAAPAPLLFVEVRHEATFPVLAEAGEAREMSYRNTFLAIPADVPFRPARVTPKPRIHGFLTGVIQAGPDGETGGVAKLDSEGRYTVQFHFDTTQRGEAKASHPVRMAQPFAGADYGMHFPLRPGTEVLLAFAHGDPDRPVIVGSVYNTTSPSPVVGSNAQKHRLKSPSGILFELGGTSKS